MRVVYSPDARQDLRGVWHYNAEHRSAAQASAYAEFLIDGIDRLADDHHLGKPLHGFPGLMSITLRKRPRGDGHIIVYEVDFASETVSVLHVFHTKQDLHGRLSDER